MRTRKLRPGNNPLGQGHTWHLSCPHLLLILFVHIPLGATQERARGKSLANPQGTDDRLIKDIFRSSSHI